MFSKELLKYFNGTAISTSFVTVALVLHVNFDLHLNDFKFFIKPYDAWYISTKLAQMFCYLWITITLFY